MILLGVIRDLPGRPEDSADYCQYRVATSPRGNHGRRFDDDRRQLRLGGMSDRQVWDEDFRLAKQAPGLVGARALG
jgi:hypothetical protein